MQKFRSYDPRMPEWQKPYLFQLWQTRTHGPRMSQGNLGSLPEKIIRNKFAARRNNNTIHNCGNTIAIFLF